MNEQRPVSSQPTHGTPVSPRPVASQLAPQAAPKVVGQQTRPPGDRELAPIGLVDEIASAPPVSKIRMFHTDAGMQHKEAKYTRQPCHSGQGACRVRTFHGRLSDEGLAFMDDKVNEWLDRHPEIDVKHVTTAVGQYDGKVKEPALIMNVWY